MLSTIMEIDDQPSASSWGCELKWIQDIHNILCVISSASSWGCELKYSLKHLNHAPHSVSLFVRLWVEMLICNKIQVSLTSASSWGCELKYVRLCEYVSWYIVSLFVRLWVEMHSVLPLSVSWLSASSWGCELKWKFWTNSNSSKDVSLFVRLWVEIRIGGVSAMRSARQPLREAVSWNTFTSLHTKDVIFVSLFVRLWVEIGTHFSYLLCM